MPKEFRDFTDAELIDTFYNFWDEDDATSSLLELAHRKHPKLADFCKTVFNRGEFDPYDQRFAIFIMYNYVPDIAIPYIIENYKKWNNLVIGQIMELLWVDSNVYQENKGKVELVRLVKEYAKTLNKQQINEIKDDYENFMKMF